MKALRHIVDPILHKHISSPSSQDVEGGRRGAAAASSFWKQIKNGNSIGKNYRSSLRRRCNNYLACEHHIPVVEIHNAIFYQGNLWLNKPDEHTLAHIRNLTQLFASRSNHLPVNLAHNNANGGAGSTWIPGPRIILFDSNNAAYLPPKGFDGPSTSSSTRSSTPPPTTCARVWDTSSFFLFPWELGNAYHTVNDNVLSVLASVVLQHVTDITHYSGAGVDNPSHRTLFTFKGPNGSEKAQNSSLNSLLRVLFDGDVQQAAVLLDPEAGPHCVRRVVWGSAAKPFYVDGLGELRKVLHAVLRQVLHLKFGEKPVRLGGGTDATAAVGRESRTGTGSKHSWPDLNQLQSTKGAHVQVQSEEANDKEVKIKVVIVSRNLGGVIKGKEKLARTLMSRSEIALLNAFAQIKGVQVERCCNFAVYDKPEALLSVFANADVCIGVHGAGLTNCVLGPKGMVLFELQGRRFPYFGFDSFMKIAHMADGIYACYVAYKVGDSGMELTADAVGDIVHTSMTLVGHMLRAKGVGGGALSLIDKHGNFLEADAGGLVMFTAPNDTRIVIVPTPYSSSPSLLPVHLLGPLGAPDVDPSETGVIPYYAARGYMTRLNYAESCRRLPYYAFRIYTKELINVNTPTPCDQNKILRKPTPDSLALPFERQIRHYLR